jgi:hypothetical protein
VSSNSTHFDEGRCRSRGSGLARRLTDPAYNLVPGTSLLLPFARKGVFGDGDALILGAVGGVPFHGGYPVRVSVKSYSYGGVPLKVLDQFQEHI